MMAQSRRSLFGRLSIALVLVVAIAASLAVTASAQPNQRLHKRILNLTSLASDVQKTDIPNPPPGAFATSFQLSKGQLFAWQSKTPHNEADAEVVVISVHGVDRNAETYFKTINKAFRSVRGTKPNAPVNTIRIAPQFFASPADDQALNSTTLAWSEDNNWSVGYGSLHPTFSRVSSFTVLDELINRFSNRNQFPKVRQITLVGNGGGGMLMARYSALRRGADPNGVKLRFVIGSPSAMLYFGDDRPDTVDKSKCPYYDDYFYGLGSYDAPYQLNRSASSLFKAFAQRDVRYLVGLQDVSTSNGDQSCGARAQGGPKRAMRTLAYWKYINLLAGADASSLSNFPGDFASLKSNSKLGNFRTSSGKTNHKLYQMQDQGHDADGIQNSEQGKDAIFGL